MFSTTTRLRLQNILKRVAKGEEVTLQDRVYLSKHADHDQTVSAALKRARRLQQQNQPVDSIDNLLTELDLGAIDPKSNFRPGEDDLGDWFMGAPSWLGRS